MISLWGSFQDKTRVEDVTVFEWRDYEIVTQQGFVFTCIIIKYVCGFECRDARIEMRGDKKIRKTL